MVVRTFRVVLTGRPGVLGLLIGLSLAAACSTEQTAPVPDAAVASYSAPRDAPAFCARLANSTELPRVPAAIGSLAAGAGPVEAKLSLTGAISELRTVQDDVRAASGYAALEADLDGLVAALTQATDGPLTQPVLSSISEGLAAVGEHAQPVCRFPA
jgi:hypothetical protein